MERLIKINPERHIYRWYSVGIQSTLVDGIAVIYGWGSLKSTFQQWRTINVGSMEEAEICAARILTRKLDSGYERESPDQPARMINRNLHREEMRSSCLRTF